LHDADRFLASDLANCLAVVVVNCYGAVRLSTLFDTHSLAVCKILSVGSAEQVRNVFIVPRIELAVCFMQMIDPGSRIPCEVQERNTFVMLDQKLVGF
jgi:hypothetical protein